MNTRFSATRWESLGVGLVILLGASGCGSSDGGDLAGSRSARPGPAAAEGSPPVRQAQPVSRYVVLDGPGAIASLHGQDPMSPTGRQRLAQRAAALRSSHDLLRPRLEAAGATIIADLVLVTDLDQHADFLVLAESLYHWDPGYYGAVEYHHAPFARVLHRLSGELIEAYRPLNAALPHMVSVDDAS